MNPHHVTFEGAGLKIAGDRWDVPEDVETLGTVLMLHGGGQTRHSWHQSGSRFAEQGWTSITIDSRGHGDSDWAPRGEYGMDALVADLTAVVGQLDEPPVLIGASMGGITSLVAVGEKHVTARALVLVDIATRTQPEGTKRIHDFMVGNLGGFGSLEEVADAISAYNPHRPRPKSLEGLKKNVRLKEDGRWYWHWDPAFIQGGDEPSRVAAPERLQDAARGVTIPTLLVRGRDSDVLSAEGAQEFKALIPGVHMREAAAGHMVAGDDNDVFAGHVVDFLNETVIGS